MGRVELTPFSSGMQSGCSDDGEVPESRSRARLSETEPEHEQPGVVGFELERP
jgi:hypothetical protein